MFKDSKPNLSETAQNKLKALVAETVESKVEKEIKKIARKLTVKFIITGVALAGACLLISKSDKIAELITKPKN